MITGKSSSIFKEKIKEENGQRAWLKGFVLYLFYKLAAYPHTSKKYFISILKIITKCNITLKVYKLAILDVCCKSCLYCKILCAFKISSIVNRLWTMLKFDKFKIFSPEITILQMSPFHVSTCFLLNNFEKNNS